MAHKDEGGRIETAWTKVVASDESKQARETEGRRPGSGRGRRRAWMRRQRARCAGREAHSRHKSQERLKGQTGEDTQDSVEVKQMTEGIKAGDAHGGAGKVPEGSREELRAKAGQNGKQ